MLLVLPILIPLVTAVACLFAARSVQAQRWISVIGGGALVAASIALFSSVWTGGIQAVQIGSWSAPFGITLVADLLSAVMVVITGVMGFAVAVFGMGYMGGSPKDAAVDAARERTHYHAFFHFLLMGVCGAFVTGDLFNLYVWFEVMLIASFVLLVLGNERAQVRGAVPYVVLSLVGSLCFLAAVGLLYGVAGTLNLADLAVKLPLVESPGLVTAISMLFLVAFGAKAAVFPLFFWLPASYHTPPIPVAGLFAGLLTKVGVYALIRVYTLLFVQDVGYTHTLLLWIAGLTMVIGVLGAAAQQDVRRILSFHIISQIGYMIMGLALFTPLALVGAVFYLVHHIIVKTNLFLVAGVAQRLTGSFDLKQMGGLYQRAPWLAVLFLIPAFSLAGFPPLSGFWAKLVIIKAGVDLESWAIVVAALAVGVLTLFSMTKIWNGAFWAPLKENTAEGMASAADIAIPSRARMALLVAPIVLLAIGTVVIGLWAEPFFVFAERAAADLLDPSAYVEAVLGEGAMAAGSPTAPPLVVPAAVP